MCLVGIALNVSERFPLVIAANRDEFCSRPTAPLAWWGDDEEPILGGRDLRGGGTWLGATKAGRIALVTNVRAPEHVPSDAPSRGEIVRYWLSSSVGFDDLERHVTRSGFAGVNVVAFEDGRMEHVSNHGRPRASLRDGTHALSNATLDSPWPKAEKLKARLADVMGREARSIPSAEALAEEMLEALADDEVAPDDRLPDTGVGLEMERSLSPAFLRLPELGYGTRSSTVVIATGRTLALFERTHGPGGGDRRVTIDDWPRR